MVRENLLNRLTMLDFMAVDMQLFLDTHPDDTNAIAKYNSIIREADNLRAQYEKSVGPLFSFRSYSPTENFQWVDNPWPWENKFNFSLD